MKTIRPAPLRFLFDARSLLKGAQAVFSPPGCVGSPVQPLAFRHLPWAWRSRLICHKARIAGIGMALLFPLVSRAAVFTWDGGGNGNLGGAANWNPDGAPPNDGSADLVLSGASQITPNAQVAYSINSLLFSDISSLLPFTITGEKVTLVENAGSPPFIRNETSLSNSFSNIVEFQDGGTVRAQNGNLTFSNTFISGPAGGAGDLLNLTADAGRTLTFGGTVAGTGSLRVAGLGTVRFNGANINSGPITVAGTAEVGGNLAGTSSITVSGTLRLLSANRIANAPMLLNGNLSLQGFQETIGQLSGNGIISLGTDGDLQVYQNTDSTFEGTISGAGFGNSFRKDGSGVLTLAGPCSYQGTTTVVQGTLRAGKSGVLAPFADVVVETGGTLDLNSWKNAAPTLTGTGRLHLPGASEMVVGGQNEDFTYEGTVTGTGSLKKTGTGTMTLHSASTSSLFEGVVDIGGGVVELASTFGPNARVSVGNGSTLRVAPGGQYQLHRGGLLLNGNGVGGTGALHIPATVAGVTSISAPVTLAGSATIRADLPPGGTSMLSLGNFASTEELAFSGLSLTAAGSAGIRFYHAFTGSGALNLSNTARNELHRNNTAYTGPINVNSGILVLYNNNALGSGTQPVTIAESAKIYLEDGVNITTARPLALSGELRIVTQSATASWAGTGPLQLADSASIHVTSSSALTLSGSGTITAASALKMTVAGTGSTLILARNIAAPFGFIVQPGLGTVQLDGSITAANEVWLQGGSLRLGASDRILDTARLIIGGSASFHLNNFSEKTGGLGGAGNVELGTGTLTLVASSAGTLHTHSGDISGSGNVIIESTQPGRQQIFSTANSYTGQTTVRDGSVLMVEAAGALSSTARLTVTTGGEVRLGAAGETVGSLSGDGKVVHSATGATLTLSGEFPANPWSGSIEGPGGLLKTGTNRGFTMTTPQLHTGPTRISGGTLTSAGLPFSQLTIDAGTQVSADGVHSSIDCSGSLKNHLPGDTIEAESLILREGGSIEMDFNSWTAPPVILAETLHRFGGSIRMKGDSLPVPAPGEVRIVKIARTDFGVTGNLTGIPVTLLGSLTFFTGIVEARVTGNDLEVVFTAPAGDASYFDWIGGFSVGNQTDPGADPDKDGIPNAVEYVTGGDPSSTNAPGQLYLAAIDETHLIFSYLRMTRAIHLDPVVEYSPNLLNPWSSSDTGAGVTTSVISIDPTRDLVTVRIPRTGRTNLFARLRVYVPPT